MGRVRLDVSERFCTKRWPSAGTGSRDSGHSTEPAGVQGVFGQRSKMYGLISGWSCVEQGVELGNPRGSLATQGNL